MRNHLWQKLWLRLSISFLAAALLVIGAVAWMVRASVEASFSQYINVSNVARFGGDLVAALENHYLENGGWAGADSLLPGRGRGDGAAVNSTSEARGAQVFVADVDGIIVAATQPDWVGLVADAIGPSRQVDLLTADRVVGTLGEQTPGTVALNEAENRFLQETANGLVLTALFGGLLAVIVGISLSYSLTRPLQHLTDAIRGWQLRSTPAPIAVGGTDEIRRLSAAFNDLADRLAAGEAQRRRMSADIAHELRTPVTITRGHLEAMMDGVYPLDAAHLAVAYDQVLHLARLVEDLRLLTLVEAGQLPLNPVALDIQSLILSAGERFAPLAQDRGLILTTHLPEETRPIYADPIRLQQVLDNLLTNAWRHTPDAGRITITVSEHPDELSVTLYNDSIEPLDDTQIAHLFDRFWRGDAARERDSGGSGLGLAISRELLRLQGGEITASREPGGLRFTFTLPTHKGDSGPDDPA